MYPSNGANCPVEAGEDDDSKTQGSWRLYMLFINSAGKLQFTSLNLLALLMALSELAPEIYIRAWTESAPEDGSWFGWYAFMAAFACATVGFAYWILYTVVAVRAAIDLHERMLNTTMRATLAFLTSTQTGNLLNRFSQDANLFAKVLPFYIFRTMYMFYSVLALIGVILSSATYMSALLPVILLSIYLIQRFYLRTSRQVRHLDLEEKAPLYTYLNETAHGVTYIHAFAWAQKNLEKGYQLLDNSQQPFYLMLCVQQWLNFVLGILTTLIAVTLVSIVVWGEGGISPSAVGLFFLSLLNLQKNVVYLVEAWNGSETSIACLSRLKRYIEKTPQEPMPLLQEPLPHSWPVQGTVKLTNVSSHYKSTANMPPTVRDVSLSVNAGQKIGLVGRTGSGKSSLLLTLLGLLSYNGTVEIDDVNIAHIDPDVLRAHIVTITQHPVQFDDTIRENLLPFTMNDDVHSMDEEQRRQGAARDTDLIELLDRLRLWRKIQDKCGLDAMLRDVGYSKGEIHLLSVARAITRRQDTASKLVLIDEATSNLDPEREEATQQIMDEAFAGCTVLTIAHRPEALRDVDCKMEMSDGRMMSVVHTRGTVSDSSS